MVVPTHLPGRDRFFDLLNGTHSAVKVLADENIQFNLSHVEPAAVPGGVDELHAVAETFGGKAP
jgi:hypothetical protein